MRREFQFPHFPIIVVKFHSTVERNEYLPNIKNSIVTTKPDTNETRRYITTPIILSFYFVVRQTTPLTYCCLIDITKDPD